MAKATKKTTAAKTATKREKKPPVTIVSDTTRRICRVFKAVRKKHGLTQQALADELELGLPYIKGVEQERWAPAHEIVKHLAKKYSLDMNWVYGLKKRTAGAPPIEEGGM